MVSLHQRSNNIEEMVMTIRLCLGIVRVQNILHVTQYNIIDMKSILTLYYVIDIAIFIR